MSGWRLPRRMPGPPVEPPGWVRVFNPEDWRDDDTDAGILAGLPAGSERYRSCRDWHAERRWVVARNAWYRQHPAAEARWVAEFLQDLDKPV